MSILSNKNTIPSIGTFGGAFGSNMNPVVNGIIQESANFPYYILAENAANEDFIIQE
tara:strand:+ start:729 stop:899 length:171 start_codon:yes stop_codon:yes gene_type:complete